MFEKQSISYKISILFFSFLAFISFYVFSRFTVDDAFITFRYGKNLIDFGIWNYNPSDIDMVQAYTNPIYAVLSIIPNLFHWDVILFFKIVSLLLLVLFSIWFIKKTKKSWLMLLIFISIPSTVIHLFGGLETFLYVFLISVLLVSLYEEKFWTSIIVTVLLFFTRGESWPLVALVPFYFLCKTPYFNFYNIKNDTSNYLKSIKFNFPKFLIALVVLTLTLTLFFYYHYSQFGSALPNTYYVKSGGEFSLFNFLFFSLLISPLFLAIPVSRLNFILVVGAYFLAILFVYSKSNLSMNYSSRFGFHIFAPVYFFMVYLREDIVKYWSQTFIKERAYYILLFFVTCTFFVLSSRDSIGLATYYERALISHAKLGKILDSTSHKYNIKSFSFGDAGMVAYHSKLNALDNIGLGNSHVARYGVDNNYLNNFNPDILMFYSDSNKILDKYYQKEIYNWGVFNNYKRICGVYWRSNYVIDIFSNKDINEIKLLCKESKEKNSLSDIEMLSKSIFTAPWKYWRE